MSKTNHCVLIIGESGTGKSTSIRTLPPSETFIINVMGKALPFKGSNSLYKEFNNENTDGNIYSQTDPFKIVAAIKFINDKRPDIKNLIIDDYTYIVTTEFMERATEKGFNKFAEMAKNSWSVLYEAVKGLRKDLTCFILAHSEMKAEGVIKTKTIGKMTDEKVNIEGLFSVVLHSIYDDGQYKFLTNRDDIRIAKSPFMMFESKFIDNDLSEVKKSMEKYYNNDEAEGSEAANESN